MYLQVQPLVQDNRFDIRFLNVLNPVSNPSEAGVIVQLYCWTSLLCVYLTIIVMKGFSRYRQIFTKPLTSISLMWLQNTTL